MKKVLILLAIIISVVIVIFLVTTRDVTAPEDITVLSPSLTQ